MKLYHTDFDLTVRVVTREGDPPPAVVLRRLVKHLGRAWDIKVLRAATAPGPAAAAALEQRKPTSTSHP